MGKWTGRMPTRLLSDTQIRPTEYRRWRDAVRYFESRDKDRAKVAELKESIRKGGLQEPLILGISERHPTDVYVADGHHRAVVIMDLGVKQFPFRWYWIKSAGVRMERDPFPYHVLDL